MNYLDLFESFTQKIVNNAKNTTQEDKRKIVANIQFEDPEVERICHEHGVYTISDARKVTSIKKWFKENTAIETFNELKYFTGLNEIEEDAFVWCLRLKSVIIPNSVASIGDVAFAWCPCLKSVIIPDSVASIGYAAFSECKTLESINIPSSVTIIGDKAFNSCATIKSINIPDGVTSIKERAFMHCTSLQSINIPDSVTSIGNLAFLNCKSLQSINIPDSVTIIGKEAFCDCYNLQSINIPDSVTSIGNCAFDGCASIKAICISKRHPLLRYLKRKKETKNCKFIDQSEMNESFTKNVINKVKSIKSNNNDKRDKVLFQIDFKDPEVERICHEHGVYTRGDAAKVSTINHRENSSWFKDNELINDFNEFQYFTGLKEIGQSSFYGCKNLKYITIPANVEIIEDYAFCDCESLETINIPDTVIKFGEDVITWCRSLRTIIISKNHPIKKQLLSLKKKKNYHFNFITIDDIKNMIGGLKLAIGKK